MRQIKLDQYVIDFIDKHFNEINFDRVEWVVTSKEEAIKSIQEYDYMAGWFITEVMSWGMDQSYHFEIEVGNDDEDFIIKIDNSYFMLDYGDAHMFIEVFPEVISTEKIVYNRTNIQNISLDETSDDKILPHGTVDNYLIMVGIRSLEYTYADSILFDNIDYFKRCQKKGLSAYKALLFFHDYLNGEVDI